jgi:antirestriction protein
MTFSINTSTVNQEVSTDDSFALSILDKEIPLDVEYFDNTEALEEHSVNPEECEFAIRVTTAIESGLKGGDCGVWIDPFAYHSCDDFLEACGAVHGAEHEPEFKFVDRKGVPQHFMTLTSVDRELWHHMAVWEDLDNSMRAILPLYWEYNGTTDSIENVQDAYIGSFMHESELGWYLLEESGQLDQIPENLRAYIDFKSYACDVRLDGGLYWFDHGPELHAFHPR